MSVQAAEFEPYFDPNHVGRSLDAAIPIKGILLKGLVKGDVVTNRVGDGIEIDGVRDWELGDDARHIHWSSVARRADGQLSVQQHMDEITPDAFIVTDGFRDGSDLNRGYTPKQLLTASVIANLLTTLNAERTPASLIASTADTLYVQERRGQGQRYRIRTGQDMAGLMSPDHGFTQASDLSRAVRTRRVGKLEHPVVEGDEEISLAQTLRRAGRVATGGLVIIVSDFVSDSLDINDPTLGWLPVARKLAKQNNKLLAVQITSPGQYELYEDIENYDLDDETFVVGSDPEDSKGQHIRASYAENTAAQKRDIDNAMGSADRKKRKLFLGHIELSTNDSKWRTNFRKQLRKVKSSR